MCNEFVDFTFVKPFTTNLLGKNGLVWFGVVIVFPYAILMCVTLAINVMFPF